MKMDQHQHETERSVVLVISPLVSLMIDQVSGLKSRGVSVAIFRSIEKSLRASDKDLSTPGKFSLLFAAPEALIGIDRWKSKFVETPLFDRVVAIAVDEAHCLSRW